MCLALLNVGGGSEAIVLLAFCPREETVWRWQGCYRYGYWSLQIAEVWRNFIKLVARVALWRLVSVRRLRIRILQEPHLNEVITNVPATTEYLGRKIDASTR